MIWHVYQRALETGLAKENIVIATDHPEIEAVCKAFDAQVVMTCESHESGTDRLAEVALALGWSKDDIVVNLQGDEPLVPQEYISLVANAVAESGMGMATLGCDITSVAELSDPNCVKLVADTKGKALYFSRATIPFVRDGVSDEVITSHQVFQRHIGMYAYRVDTLLTLAELTPVALEELEKLEQLRALFNGIDIHVTRVAERPAHGVDTLEDLERVRQLIA